MINCLSVDESDFKILIHLQHASQCEFTKIILDSADIVLLGFLPLTSMRSTEISDST